MHVNKKFNLALLHWKYLMNFFGTDISPWYNTWYWRVTIYYHNLPLTCIKTINQKIKLVSSDGCSFTCIMCLCYQITLSAFRSTLSAFRSTRMSLRLFQAASCDNVNLKILQNILLCGRNVLIIHRIIFFAYDMLNLLNMSLNCILSLPYQTLYSDCLSICIDRELWF